MATTVERRDAVRLGTVDAPYVFKRVPRRRHVHILVNDEGTLEVRAPWRFSLRKAREALRENAEWVLNSLAAARERLARRPRLVTGARLPLLDGSLHLDVRPRAQIDMFECARPSPGARGAPGDGAAGQHRLARRRRAARADRALVSPGSGDLAGGASRAPCVATRRAAVEGGDPRAAFPMGKLLGPGDREPQLATDDGAERARRLRSRPRAVPSPAHGPLAALLGDGGRRHPGLPAAGVTASTPCKGICRCSIHLFNYANTLCRVTFAWMLTRTIKPTLNRLLDRNPAVVLIGPRQAGKTTLARELARERDAVYVDLERPSDLAKLSDIEQYCDENAGHLLVLDEVHRVPGLFAPLRSVIDERRHAGKRTGLFLLLGSASIDLLKQSSETLAGRVAHCELHPFNSREVPGARLRRLWCRGGFPESYLARSDEESFDWRLAFIRTYLERDIPQFGPRIPAETLRRFWTMLAHNQGQMHNAAALARGLDVNGVTIARYLDLMVDLLLIRRLVPWTTNLGRRLVKAPKVYVRDSGVCHALLGIETMDDLFGHPVIGGSWEGFVIENIAGALPARRHVATTALQAVRKSTWWSISARASCGRSRSSTAPRPGSPEDSTAPARTSGLPASSSFTPATRAIRSRRTYGP